MCNRANLRHHVSELAAEVRRLEARLDQLQTRMDQPEAAAPDSGRGRSPRKPLTVEQILAWAQTHKERTGQWPRVQSGPIPEAPGETWARINAALHVGCRGLPRSSLSRLLHHCQADRPWARRQLTLEQVLAWADAWKERSGQYPNVMSGPIPEAPGLNWQALDRALRHGRHQLPAGSSLSRLLREQRGYRRHQRQLTEEQILAWAQHWKQRTGCWPAVRSGLIPEAPGLRWSALDQALREGSHGLPGGSSLSQLIQKRREKKRVG